MSLTRHPKADALRWRAANICLTVGYIQARRVINPAQTLAPKNLNGTEHPAAPPWKQRQFLAVVSPLLLTTKQTIYHFSILQPSVKKCSKK